MVGPDPARSPRSAPDPARPPRSAPDPRSPKSDPAPDPARSPKSAPDPARSPKSDPDPARSPKSAPDPAGSPKSARAKTAQDRQDHQRITKNVTRINKRNVSVFRERRRVWSGGFWRTFVPIVALSGLYIGSQYYDPDGYVAVARPYCSGVSEEGYSLRWQEVPVEGGGTERQCVQFRPRVQTVDLPPPPPPQTLVTPPPAPVQQAAGSCELTVYSEPNFGGMSSPATENLASLEEEGWKYEIASVQVIAGTWEFYAEDEFTGDSMRLPPGSHGDLGEWTKRIASLMCIEPSARDRLSGN